MKQKCLWLIVALLLCQGCNPCKEEIWSQSLSPNGLLAAVVVMRDCGATSPETVSVNIATKGSRSYSEANNAIVVKHGHAFEAVWMSNSAVKISCDDCQPSEILKQRNQIRGVYVSFRLAQ